MLSVQTVYSQEKTCYDILNSRFCISLFSDTINSNGHRITLKDSVKDITAINSYLNNNGFTIEECKNKICSQTNFDSCVFDILNIQLLSNDTFTYNYDKRIYYLDKYQFTFSFQNNLIVDSFAFYTSGTSTRYLTNGNTKLKLYYTKIEDKYLFVWNFNNHMVSKYLGLEINDCVIFISRVSE